MKPLPVSTRLSQLLVAFTIECDNEFEHRMPHRTAADRGRGVRGPWLVSMAMWVNFLRPVPAEGMPLRALAGPYGLPKLAGLQRWGYLVVQPDPDDPRPVPPAADWLVAPTRSGRRAQEIWQPLAAEVEARWVDRFGAEVVAELRQALQALGTLLDPTLPFFPPVLGHGLFANTATPAPGPLPGAPDLLTLLSRPLVAFTADVESGSPVSLAMTADVLRVLDGDGVRMGDLPRLGGVSREAVAMAVGWLEHGGQVTVGTGPGGGRAKLVSLTDKGIQTRQGAQERVAEIEQTWQLRYGEAALGRVRTSVDSLVARPRTLAVGLDPYPEGWRWSKPYAWQTTAMLEDPLGALPHHPMVLHRGGFPDGS